MITVPLLFRITSRRRSDTASSVVPFRSLADNYSRINILLLSSFFFVLFILGIESREMIREM